MGGTILSAYTAVDIIKSSRIEIHSIVEGYVASAGTLLSVVCKKRYIRPTGYMLIHQLTSCISGKMSELIDGHNNLSQMQNVIRNI